MPVSGVFGHGREALEKREAWERLPRRMGDRTDIRIRTPR